jgi:hypothetical protein
VAERPEKRSLLKAKSSPGGRITDSKPPVVDAEVQMSAEEEAALAKETEAERKKILAELDAMQAEAEAAQADVEVNEGNSGPKAEETTAAKRPISDLETMRISAREARRLGRLGRRLKNVQVEPNRVEDGRAESDVNLIEPNLSGLKLNDVNVPG